MCSNIFQKSPLDWHYTANFVWKNIAFGWYWWVDDDGNPIQNQKDLEMHGNYQTFYVN